MSPQDPSQTDLPSSEAPEPSTVEPESRPRLWRNVLFFAGSAAFGGLAVVLWNRRELAQIQKERSRQTTGGIPEPVSDDEELI